MSDWLNFIPIDRIAQISVYVVILLNAWILLPLLIVLISVPLIRKSGIDRLTGFELNTRGFAVFTVPILAAFEQVLNFYRFLWPVLFLAVFAGSKQGIPAIGSADRHLAHQIFGCLFALYVAALLPVSFGLPLVATARQLPEFVEMQLKIFRWSALMMVGAVAYYYPGEWGSIVAVVCIVQTILILRMTLWSMAMVNFNATPEVKIETTEGGAQLYFLQTSDVHATFPEGSDPAGGGRAGTAELRHVAEDIANKRRVPTVLVDTGDVVDRGRVEEWDAPLQTYRRIRDCGTRVIIAPGNHDLVPSYNFVDALWAVSSKRFLVPEVDGTRVLKYLDVASDLEPELLDCKGNQVRATVTHEKNRLSNLIGAWDWARDQAAARLERPNLGHVPAMSRLRSRDAAAASQIEEEFVRRVMAGYPETNESAWRHFLFHASPRDVDLLVTSRLWANRWSEFFPLRLELTDDGVEFLILNSVAKDARFAGSAYGRLGEDQVQRLAARLNESHARVVVILHHHACFRFPREASDPFLQRWALLVHDPVESQACRKLLFNAAASGKQIIMLSGHVHLRSRCGLLDKPAEDTRSGLPVWVLESGALGEKGSEMMPSGWLDASGLVSPRLVSRFAT